MNEKIDDAMVANANLVEHMRNIDAACDDARLSAAEKIRRVKEEVEKAQMPKALVVLNILATELT